MAVNTNRRLKIAIIGGGIGGLFAALSIHHHCTQSVDIDVYEQAPQYKEIGAGVGIGVNAAKLLAKIDLLDEAAEIAGSRNRVWLSFRRYDNGGEIFTVPIKETGKVRQLPVARSEFLELLYQTIKKRGAASLHTNKACRGLEEAGDSMVVTFEDGTTATADLVIGADGIHSNVRSHYIIDNPRYSGKIVYRSLCPISKLQEWWPLETYGAAWLSRGKHFLVFPISKNKTLNVVAFVTKSKEELGDTKESWTLAGDKASVQEEFKDFDPTVQKIIEHMNTMPQKWLLYDRQPFKQWVFAEGKVALIGDSAHAMLPHQGAGAGQAIEDGYILSRALQDYFQSDASGRNLKDWLNLYQAVRLPRAERVQDTSRECGEVYELGVDELKGLSYDECLPIVRDLVRDRMTWIWTEDIDVAYENARE